jgi:transcriptional regulator of acetoin/glycerol metabolism
MIPNSHPAGVPTHSSGEVPAALAMRVGMTLREVEKLLIAATLKQTRHNVSASAKILGIDRSTLYSKIKTYGL